MEQLQQIDEIETCIEKNIAEGEAIATQLLDAHILEVERIKTLKDLRRRIKRLI
jgi:hypothetical protein